MTKPVTKKEYRTRRHSRLRQKIRGTADRPRMSVFVSNKHMYVQFIDDDAERTLASVSTLAGSAKGATGLTAESAAQLGKAAAEAAGKAGVKRAVFDRGGFKYGRRIKALADAARESGLVI